MNCLSSSEDSVILISPYPTVRREIGFRFLNSALVLTPFLVSSILGDSYEYLLKRSQITKIDQKDFINQPELFLNEVHT